MFSSTPGLYALDANVFPLPLPQLWQPKMSPSIAKYSLGSTIAPSWECLIRCAWENFHRCFWAVCGWRPSCWKLTLQIQHKKEHISYNLFYVVVGTFSPLGNMVTVILNIFKHLLCTRNFWYDMHILISTSLPTAVGAAIDDIFQMRTWRKWH